MGGNISEEQIDGKEIDTASLKALLDEFNIAQKKFHEKFTEIRAHSENELNRIIT